jgi:hypothetical protein
MTLVNSPSSNVNPLQIVRPGAPLTPPTDNRLALVTDLTSYELQLFAADDSAEGLTLEMNLGHV